MNIHMTEGRLHLSSDIEIGRWYPGDQHLFTSEASTCLVLAAHNTEERKGLLGHFTSLIVPDASYYSNQAVFDEAVAALPTLGDPTHTNIWIGGGRPCIEDGFDTVIADRAYALGALAAFRERHGSPVTSLIVDWSPPDVAIDVGLDCPSGELTIGRYPS